MLCQKLFLKQCVIFEDQRFSTRRINSSTLARKLPGFVLRLERRHRRFFCFPRGITSSRRISDASPARPGHWRRRWRRRTVNVTIPLERKYNFHDGQIETENRVTRIIHCCTAVVYSYIYTHSPVYVSRSRTRDSGEEWWEYRGGTKSGK